METKYRVEYNSCDHNIVFGRTLERRTADFDTYEEAKKFALEDAVEQLRNSAERLDLTDRITDEMKKVTIYQVITTELETLAPV